MKIRGLHRRHPIRLLLAFLIFLIGLYALVFSIFMRIFEGQTISTVDALFWAISYLTTTGESTGKFTITTAPLEILAVIVQFSGLVLFFSAFPLVILPQIEKRFRQTLPNKVDEKITGHIVICGYNPLVESLMEELSSGALPFVIVDRDQEMVKSLNESGWRCIYGDPVHESVQNNAGVRRAAIVIANLEDEENANVVLTAAALGAKEIIALIDDLDNAAYFEYAGAHQVISPKELLGAYLAKKATTSLRDELFGENEILAGLDVVELPIYPESPIDGATLAELEIRKKTGASIVGVWHRGKLELEPGPESRVSAENVLMAVGTREQLIELQKLTRTDGRLTEVGQRHFVIAGFGDVGRRVSEELSIQEISFVIIDPLDRPGEYLKGDATNEEMLRRARIHQASTYIVAGHIDKDNIFTTLLARKMNPNLHILARANHQEAVDKLYRAGADFVFSLASVAGQMLARMIQGDKLVTLAEGLKVLTVPVSGKLLNRSIGQLRIRSSTGCTVIALKDDSCLIANPGPHTVLGEGSTIVVLGSRRQVQEFKELFRIRS